MRKTSSYILMAIAFVLASVPAYAEVGGASIADASRITIWVVITAGFSMAIASAVCGLGQAKATAAAAEALARNPAARPGIQLALILGLALIESLALYTLVIVFAKVSVPQYLQPR